MAGTGTRATGGDKSAQAVVDMRRVRVFEGLCYRGQTPAELAVAEKVSEETIARDIKAVRRKLAAWAADRISGALSFALAQMERAMTEAWDAYDEARTIQRAWLAGAYDRTELHPDPDGGMREVRKPPILRVEIAALLGKAIEATKEYAKLAGLDKQDVTLHGDLLLRRYEGVNIDEV